MAPNEPHVDHLGSSQEKTGSGSESSTNGKEKPVAEKSPREVTAEQSKVPEVKTKTKTEAGTSSQQSQNRTVRFSKPDYPVSTASGQKKASKTTVPGTAPAPHWCPLGLAPNQRRRNQWMRAQKMREEMAKKERDEYFNIARR
jgi:hypothetical protein